MKSLQSNRANLSKDTRQSKAKPRSNILPPSISDFTVENSKSRNDRESDSLNIFGLDSASSSNNQTDRMRVPHFLNDRQPEVFTKERLSKSSTRNYPPKKKNDSNLSDPVEGQRTDSQIRGSGINKGYSGSTTSDPKELSGSDDRKRVP